MPCTAGIKVAAAHVGVPASDAHMAMGWNAMAAKHKELHPEVQQTPLARIGLQHSTHGRQYHCLTLLYELTMAHQGVFSALSQSLFRQSR